MATQIEIMKDIKNALSGIDVNTIKIGIEKDISPSDFPLIRIVPENALPGEPSFVRTRMNFNVYVGVPTLEQDNEEGLEQVYEELDALELQVRQKLEANTIFRCNWQETLWDNEFNEGGFQLLCSRFFVIK